MNITILKAAKLTKSQTSKISKVLTGGAKIAHLKDTKISLLMISAKEIKDLNKTYRNKDKITDVLSFFYPETKEGEIFICLEQANRQAKEHKHTLLKELIILAVHGLVHIAGYDHETDEDYQNMKKIEDKILKIYG